MHSDPYNPHSPILSYMFTLGKATAASTKERLMTALQHEQDPVALRQVLGEVREEHGIPRDVIQAAVDR